MKFINSIFSTMTIFKSSIRRNPKRWKSRSLFSCFKKYHGSKKSVNNIAKDMDKLQEKSVNFSLEKEPLTLENLLFILHSVNLTIDFKPILE